LRTEIHWIPGVLHQLNAIQGSLGLTVDQADPLRLAEPGISQELLSDAQTGRNRNDASLDVV